MAEWSQSSAGPARTRSGRRKHWKLPDMIQGVRHRFRDKMRSKSPDYALDDTASQTSMYKYNPENGGATLPRASSMLSTDYGFSQSEWGAIPGDGQLTRATALQSNYRTLYPASNDVTSMSQPQAGGGVPATPSLDTFRNRSGTSDFAPSSQTSRPRLPMVNESRFQGSFDNGAHSDCDFVGSSVYQSKRLASQAVPRVSGVGRAASVSAVNHAGISHGISHGGSMQRGKSVRFGENRISVFLQDSTQALEECVRLALSYAEETKRGDYCSDSEAVTLSRSLNQSHDPEIQSNDNKARIFWSDSEDRGTNKSQSRDHSRRDHVNFSEGPPTPTNYKPRTFGQAVNSLDRVERLDKYQSERSRKKRSTQINEIFSFIDKVLSGCDSGCSDEGCPFAREAKSMHAKTHRGYYGKDWSTPQSNFPTNSHIPTEHQNKKSASFPRGSTVDSYAYKGKLATEGRLAEGGFSPRSSKKINREKFALHHPTSRGRF